MGSICMKPNPKTTANDVRELEKATELAENYSCSSSSQPVFIVEFTSYRCCALQEPPAAQKQPQFSSLHMGLSCSFPKYQWSLKSGSGSEPLASGRTSKSRSQEQPSSKWINHSKNVQLFQGVYQKTAQSF